MLYAGYQERRFLVKRWQQAKALKPSNKTPALVGSGTEMLPENEVL